MRRSGIVSDRAAYKIVSSLPIRLIAGKRGSTFYASSVDFAISFSGGKQRHDNRPQEALPTDTVSMLIEALERISRDRPSVQRLSRVRMEGTLEWAVLGGRSENRFSVFVVQREELIELRLNGDQFVFALRIDADRLNSFDRDRFVIDPIHLLAGEAF